VAASRPGEIWRKRPFWLLLALAMLLRLPDLGYKELQGDEGIILTRTAAMLTGDDAELVLHQKGPVELLLPMLSWGSVSQMTEFWGRLPFALAGVAAVVALAYLATLWFDGRVGWLTGLLFAVNGFAVAFSRIIQYQSFVMLWGLLSIVAAFAYARDGRFQHLFLSMLFAAAGLLAHYDAILFIPAAAWLLLSRGWPVKQLRGWLLSLAAAAGLLAAFYVPFVLSPNFAQTRQYLLNDRIGAGSGSTVFNGSLTAVWQMITFYNSTVYIVALLLLAFVGLVAVSGRFRAERAAAGAALLLLLAPLLVYTLIVVDPRTHVYTFFPGLTVLAAAGATTLWARLPSVTSRRLALVAFLGAWVYVAVYPIFDVR
jgi:4-amino-4-deoxy-L-arabinose transferase-like glycosyltransferase